MLLLIKYTIDLIITFHLDLYVWKMWLNFRSLSGGDMYMHRETTRWWYGVTIFFKNNKKRGFV